jgi:hypothetical protein
MVTRVMPRDTAGYGAGKAPDGKGWRGRQSADYADCNKRTFDFHGKFPFAAQRAG